jgi:hypothetical protein
VDIHEYYIDNLGKIIGILTQIIRDVGGTLR